MLFFKEQVCCVPLRDTPCAKCTGTAPAGRQREQIEDENIEQDIRLLGPVLMTCTARSAPALCLQDSAAVGPIAVKPECC